MFCLDVAAELLLLLLLLLLCQVDNAGLQQMLGELLAATEPAGRQPRQMVGGVEAHAASSSSHTPSLSYAGAYFVHHAQLILLYSCASSTHSCWLASAAAVQDICTAVMSVARFHSCGFLAWDRHPLHTRASMANIMLSGLLLLIICMPRACHPCAAPDAAANGQCAIQDVVTSLDLLLIIYLPRACHPSVTPDAAALEAFGTALALHQKKKQEAVARNAAREAKRQALAAAGDDALVVQLEGRIEGNEPVPVVPAKLLNNTAVLKYRYAQGLACRTVNGYICACVVVPVASGTSAGQLRACVWGGRRVCDLSSGKGLAVDDAQLAPRLEGSIEEDEEGACGACQAAEQHRSAEVQVCVQGHAGRTVCKSCGPACSCLW
jgi:hypothetical protein